MEQASSLSDACKWLTGAAQACPVSQYLTQLRYEAVHALPVLLTVNMEYFVRDGRITQVVAWVCTVQPADGDRMCIACRRCQVGPDHLPCWGVSQVLGHLLHSLRTRRW